VIRYWSRLAYITGILNIGYNCYYTKCTSDSGSCKIRVSAIFTDQVDDVADHPAAVFVVQQVKARIANLLL